jgi:uncharacterized membrane protein YhaH (DUF805 family)
MTFTQAVRSVLSNYATFTGRARRSEYWWFYLFNILLGIATSVVDGILNTAFNNDIGIVGTVTSLALLLPSLAVTARRLHDTGRTGWWMLLPVGPGLATIAVGFVDAFAALFSGDANRVPLMGALTLVFLACGLLTLAASIVLLVFLCLDSKPGPNKYGSSPKQPPMLPTGQGGYYPPPGYAPQPPAPGYGHPYGYPQQPPPAPPTPGPYRGQP